MSKDFKLAFDCFMAKFWNGFHEHPIYDEKTGRALTTITATKGALRIKRLLLKGFRAGWEAGKGSLPLGDWFSVDCVLPRAEDSENGLIWVLFNNGDVARQHWELGGEKEAGGAYPIFWRPLSAEKQRSVRERIVREGAE